MLLSVTSRIVEEELDRVPNLKAELEDAACNNREKRHTSEPMNSGESGHQNLMHLDRETAIALRL